MGDVRFAERIDIIDILLEVFYLFQFLGFVSSE